MNKLYWCIMLILLSAVAFADIYVPGYVVFKTANPITVIQTEPQLLTDKAWFNQKILDYGITELHQIGADKIPAAYLSDRLYYYAVFDTLYAVKEVINSMKGDTEVIFAEPNFIFQPLAGVNTNDVTADDMWGLNRIGMNRVWDELGIYGAPNINVAVIDSGIDLGNAQYPDNTVSIHPDLLGNVWQESGGNYGWNYYVECPPEHVIVTEELSNYPHDKRGHGTAVAGVISAINNNEFAVSSVAGGWSGITSGAKIMPIRVMQNTASYLAVCSAFLFAYYYEARIINLSLGVAASDMTEEGFDGMHMLHEVISDVYNDFFNWCVRPLVVVAAGNNEGEGEFYPACFEEVLAVGATDIHDKRGLWNDGGSSLHATIDIVAPGCKNRGNEAEDQIGIYTTFPMDNNFSMPYNSVYDDANGTSLAAPHVAGVAALVLEQFPGISLEQLRGRLLGTSDYIYDKNQAHLGLMGSGRLNAYRALTEPEKPNLVLNGINVEGLPSNTIDIGSPQRVTFNLKNWWVNATNVWGLLTTDDPGITISYRTLGRINWGDIPREESCLSDSYVTITASGYNRIATFYLTVNSDYNDPKVMKFSMQICSPIDEDFFCDLSPALDTSENLNKNFTVKDINSDGFDEIFITSNEIDENNVSFDGNLFIVHQDGSYIRKDLYGGSTCTPAVGDVNSDGVFDIVVGNNNGQVIVFNGEYPYEMKKKIFDVSSNSYGRLITFITLEDMNNDGQLDIVAVYDKGNNSNRSNGFAVINMLDEQAQIYHYNTTYTIQHGVSVDDVDNDGYKEVVFLCQNYNCLNHNQTDLYFEMVKVDENFRFSRICSNSICDSMFEAGSSPMVCDLTDDGNRDIVLRYEWNDHNTDTTLRRNKVGLRVYNYHHPNLTLIWQYPGDTAAASNISKNDNVLIGDFAQNPGLEVLFSHDKLTLLDAFGGVIAESDRLPDEINTYQEYILAFDSSLANTKYYRLAGTPQYYRLSAYNAEFTEDRGWKYDLYSHPVNDPIGMAFIKTSASTAGIIIPRQKGQLALIPVSYNDENLKDYGKYRYNSRHTGSYNQPLPVLMRQQTLIKHNLYVENVVYFEANITINPDVRIVADPGVAIRVYGELTSIGNAESEQGLEIYGTCLSSCGGYWEGLALFNGSDSELEFCSISNASIGISYDDRGFHVLKTCSITNNEWGISTYNSNPIIKDNTIVQNSELGFALNNGASPLMGEYSAGYNSICDNPVGIFSAQSIPLLKDGHNDFVNEENIHIEFTVEPISAQKNWWGSADYDDIVQTFNDPDLILFDPWDESNNTPYEPTMNVFATAMRYMLEEQYLQAIPLFHQVLADSLTNGDDHASINSLLICYDKTDNLASYRSFILGQLENELPEKMVIWYKDCLALINRALGLFGEAITYYESKLDNSTTFADSCYALIDLGNTYFEADCKVGGKYSNLIPKSIQEHQRLKKNLLDRIYHYSSNQGGVPPVEHVILRQNYPNPFNPSTTMSFYLPERSNVKLTIYNIKGQVVNVLKDEVMNKGSHSVVWRGNDRSGKAVSSGVYLYKLQAGKTNKIRKCILIK